MSMDSDYIRILCGEFGDGYTPLTRAAFWKSYHKHHDSVQEMIDSDDEEIKSLLKRSASISFMIEEMSQKGISIVCFTDENFPHRLIEKLGDFCPPLLYTAGCAELNTGKYVGYVGSRKVNDADFEWTRGRVDDNLKNGYGVVTGGAAGIDTIALKRCLQMGGNAILYLPDNIGSKIKDADIRKAVLEKNLLIYSHVSPLAAKTRNSFVASAMERNKFIYAQSNATVVVRSDLNKGGTWAGATESLKHGWSYVYVWDNKGYPGNLELINHGAVPLSDDGDVVKDGRVTDKDEKNKDNQDQSCLDVDSGDNANKEEFEQLSLFSLINKK